MAEADRDEARVRWDRAAAAYDDMIESGHDYYRTELHGPALLRACGDVARGDVLDLGCGQGWFTRQLAAAGARVIGIDWSARLVSLAERHEAAAPLGARYLVLDAEQLATR